MKNILIIGGGTGLTTAYMLEELGALHVTLVEQSHRLGGHIHSLNFGKHGMAEEGAEFIGAPESYPNVHKLFKRLGVELNRFELNVDVVNQLDEHFVLPPIYHVTETKKRCFPCFFNSSPHQGETRVSWDTLFNRFFDLLNIQLEIFRAESPEGRKMLTLEEFVMGDFRSKCNLSRSEVLEFAHRLLYPIISAAWGVSVEKVKSYCAPYAMNYISLSNDWYDAPYGLSTYIDALKAQCSHLDLRMNTTIKKLCPIMDIDGQVRYQVLLQDGCLMKDRNGLYAVFDDVILSPSAEIMKNILPDAEKLPLADDLRTLKQRLEAVEHYDTHLVFHIDPKYITPKETVVQTKVREGYATNTLQKDWKARQGEIAIMKTWIGPDGEMPDPHFNLHEVKFRHAHIGREYYEAKLAMEKMQGNYNLLYSGVANGQGGGSHEDAINAALKAAHAICTKYGLLNQNERIKPFLDQSGQINENNDQLSVDDSRCCCVIA